MRLASGMTCDGSRDTSWGASAGKSAGSVMALRPNFEPLRESVGILGLCPAALHIPDDDDTAARIGPAGHQSRIHFPRRHGRAGLSEFKLCILSLREQAHCTAFPQKRKALLQQ